MTTTPPRALRAGAAAAVAVGVAVVAHGLGHGGVDAGAAAWVFAGLVGPSWWLARRERSWGALALTQLAGQQFAHVVLGAATVGGAHLLPMDLMLYAHLAAAALTGAWLRVGERRAWAAARRLGQVLLPVLDACPLTRPPGPAPLAVAPVAARPRTLLLRHTHARRGPPVPA